MTDMIAPVFTADVRHYFLYCARICMQQFLPQCHSILFIYSIMALTMNMMMMMVVVVVVVMMMMMMMMR